MLYHWDGWCSNVSTWKRCRLSAKFMNWIAGKWKTSIRKARIFTDQLWIWAVSSFFGLIAPGMKRPAGASQKSVRNLDGNLLGGHRWFFRRWIIVQLGVEGSKDDSGIRRNRPSCCSHSCFESHSFIGCIMLHPNSKSPLCTGDITMFALGPCLFYL